MQVMDGKGKPLGRITSKAAEEALRGKEVRIINSEEIIVTGNKKDVIGKYKKKFQLRDLGNPEKSPKIVSRRPDLFVKKIIKRMLPRDKKRGREALRRIKAFMGDPENLSDKVKEDLIKDKSDKEHITVKNICKELGWKEKR